MVIKARRLRWAGHVALIGEGEMCTGFCLGSPKVRDHWDDLGLDGKITLSWTLGRWGPMGRTGFDWLRIGSMAGFCEHGNEPSGSIKEEGYF
jgi:hypothetical protein